MDRDGLAHFLRRRRAALQPEDVGLRPGPRRRTSGLRREDVAALAHMSTDFYTRLEQRRGSRPSEAMVGAIARALRLTLDERDHLLALAGHTPPPRGTRSEHVTPALLRVLDRLDTPAQIVNDLGVTLAQNSLAEALMGAHVGGASVFYRWFTGDPAERALWPPEDHDEHSRRYVAGLRAVHARDEEARAFVATLLRESEEFARLWCEHEVRAPATTRKRIAHPQVGLIELDCQILTAENQTEMLVVFTAAPGSEDAEKLALLGVIGTETFAP
ncbi:helix-turn-helix domain-containing protein [Solirubrobacter sp. CPCC 204708]|uniref:Helix-turn-helix transcriptional regulator n=1 Tax=Solirubrobacter deserti TaxID=2282478 RepID=A0ABT4RG93_9ACTN|nr:helix-turn-helix transcriptional regulator [Solirubrobacter deserti]MBE2319735.1 helix-turn-helix domain-containing protein [Solirubrobacter deserti]MDA0137525.1 helix-turn-helix transcriptional regulator [Solirubrobacter deserti]